MNKLSFIGIIGGALFLLVAMPGVSRPVYGQLKIDNERTGTVALDAEPTSGSNMTATVTDTGYVHVGWSQTAITANSDGWTLQVEKNGKVESVGGKAVSFANTGTVNNDGAITAHTDLSVGVYDCHNAVEMKYGTVTNTGSIESGRKDAIHFTGYDPNKTNTVHNTGAITGAAYAIYSLSALNVTNGVGASINGNIYQMGSTTAASDSAVTNYGRIAGPSTAGHAVRVRSGTVQNLGKDSLIEGATGVVIEKTGTAENKVTNEGTIRAHANIGVTLSRGGTVENSGTIMATSDFGADGAHKATGIYANDGKVTIINSGTISGEIGIRLSRGTHSYDDTLDNSGTIRATKANGDPDADGTAVDMGAGNDTASFRRGTMITGWVDGGDGTDILELNDAGTQKDFKTRNFETLNFTGGETILTGAGSSVNVGRDTTVKSGATAGIEGFTFNTGALKVESTGKLINRGGVNVTSAYTQGSDSVYEVGAAPDHTFAKVGADKADIQGGTIIFNTDSVRGGKHLIVGTTSGLNGTYDQHEYNTGNYVHMSHEYDPNGRDMYAIVASVLTGAARPMTRNQRAVSRYLDDTRNSPSAFISDDMWGVYNLLNGLDVPSVRSAFDQMGGASHTAYTVIDIYRTANFYRNLFRRPSSLTSNAVEGRGNPLTMLAANMNTLTDGDNSYITKDGKKGPFNLWIKGYGTTGHRDGDDIASRYDFTVGGTMAGIDFHHSPTARAGFALGYAKTNMDMKDLRDRGSEDSLQGAVYSSYTPKGSRWYMDLAFAYSRNSYETSRYINFGTVSRAAKGSYKGSDLSGYIESGYRIPATGSFAITPHASFLALQNYRGGFTERGAQALSLVTDGVKTLSLQGALGVRAARDIRITKTFLLIPEVSARWVHEFGDDEALLDARFAGTPSNYFTVYSDRFDRDSGAFSLGITGKVRDDWGFFLAYDGQFRSKECVHAATGGVKFKW